MKLWGGRFAKETEKTVENFTSSIGFDFRLAEVDILGSLAHVTMLGNCHILNEHDVAKIRQGLLKIREKLQLGQLEWSVADEDIHMNVERWLHNEIGPQAGMLHTGRSRNDQVALDLHLYLREQVFKLIGKIHHLQSILVNLAKRHLHTWLPGYTHLQRAQPVSLAHHLLAYFWMMQRDAERLISSWPRLNLMPLGAGALAGSNYAIDRQMTARLLGFQNIYENSMDAVSDRDFVVEFHSSAALIMMHLSRYCEELILWSSQEFGFIEIDDAFCTGSSMMPQKKNPDVPELIRGKTGRVYGALFSILTVLKALPLCYNKDLQEDKEGLFDTLNTLHQSLDMLSSLLSTLTIKSEVMLQALSKGHLDATQLANYLVSKTLPFREAHAVVGKIVQYCLIQQCKISDIPLSVLKTHSHHFEDDVYLQLTLDNMASRHLGGTAPEMVSRQISRAVRKQKIAQRWMLIKGRVFQQLNQLYENRF
jgi:argininosuccinate lyase